MSVGNGLSDIIVVGGGINGAGIACDAAGRGLSVVLCERDDLASATSAASSKLIHGGLRYLEYYRFGLVRKSLVEREVLLSRAPHIIWPLRFVLPYRSQMRPAWMVRLGLFVYDHLARRRRLADSHGIDLRADPAGAPLHDSLKKAFVYSDCWVDDARLVAINAVDAALRGAAILTRTELAGARRVDGVWEARLRDRHGGAERTVRARVLVNAAGPWVQTVRDGLLGDAGANRVRLVKGSHMVVPRLYEGDHAYILQNTDRRFIFVLPYEGEFSLIGTTEVAIDGDPATPRMEADEAAYLCDAVNGYFTKPIAPDDAVWSYAGVRALFDDRAEKPSAITRDYVLDLDAPASEAPLLSVLGGKITTYRRLAEHALAKLRPFLPAMGAPWTRDEPLPGGDFPGGDVDALVGDLARAYPKLDAGYLRALARRHGTLARDVLGDAREMADLGADFGAGLRGREVDYLIGYEWAHTADDVLWRRTRCGLHMDERERAAVAEYMAGLKSAG